MLPKLIHPLQGAFVPNRSITDNVLIAHEVIHSFKKSKNAKGWIGVKLDMEKAYDRFNWKFLKEVLVNFVFNEKICKLDYGMCHNYIDVCPCQWSTF